MDKTVILGDLIVNLVALHTEIDQMPFPTVIEVLERGLIDLERFMYLYIKENVSEY